MKIKADFITNSSSTSFVLDTEASYTNISGEIEKVYNQLSGSVTTTFYALKILEAELELRIGNIDEEIEITYTQYPQYFKGDGWDGGDYSFAGVGWRFFGDINIVKEILNKKDVKLKFKNGKLSGYPKEWKTECEPEVVAKKFNIEG